MTQKSVSGKWSGNGCEVRRIVADKEENGLEGLDDACNDGDLEEGKQDLMTRE